MAEKTKKVINRRKSLNRKTFFITLALTMGIGVTVLIVGFVLYLSGVTHEYMVNTWNQANAEAAQIDRTEYKAVCDEVIRVYDSIPEEERGDGNSPEYKAKFEYIWDDKFVDVQEAMRSLQSRNGPMNAFVVALDPRTDRMIYLIDADPGEETNCRPGTYDVYYHDEIDTLINGRELSKIEENAGIERRLQAMLTNRVEYGLRCTAGSTLYESGPYTVMMCVDEKLDIVKDISKVFLFQYFMLLLVITLIAAFIGMYCMRRTLVKPINAMADAATEYGNEEDKQSNTRHFADLNIHTGDELQQLADALSGMEKDIAEYMDDLTAATAEKEKLNTELGLAAKIQQSVLTVDFPAFPDRTEFDICALMDPAKEVGGDFYDMLIIDDDHLAIEIADVSGKGVPAALFMMASKIVLSEKLKEGHTPAEVLELVNNNITARNEEEMFVTVWLGILEISTGKIVASNAGHEYPMIVHADGTAELIRDKHGFVVGGMPGMKYKDYELKLEKGDSIFVYTDGVPEATSVDSELFGTDRTLEVIGSCGKDPKPREIMKSVLDAVDEFTVGAEQFDDLTMLCLKYLGKE